MFARTDRLLLRPGWPDDALALAAAIGEWRIVRNLSAVPWPYGAGDAEAWLQRQQSDALPHLLIFERTPDVPRLAGCIGFSAEAGAIEFGYWIRSDRWNRGYATEAGHAALALARDSLRLGRVGSGHFVDNPASGRVLEKLGFEASASGERHCVARGGATPIKLFQAELRAVRASPAPEAMAA